MLIVMVLYLKVLRKLLVSSFRVIRSAIGALVSLSQFSKLSPIVILVLQLYFLVGVMEYGMWA